MEEIRQWFLSLCGATAITGIFHVFLENSSLKKSINIFLSIFVLFYTIIPLSNIEPINVELDLKNVEFSDFSKENYEQIILTAINNVCAENDVEIISVDIDSYIEDENLVVNKIEVETDTPNKSKEIEDILKNKFGFEVNVYWKTRC